MVDQHSEALDHQLQLRALATALERICHINCDLRATSPTVFDADSHLDAVDQENGVHLLRRRVFPAPHAC